MRTRKSQNGVALLISIFVLLLISVVAIALIVSSGTESALSGNYRSATAVYYAAFAGLEEARGRLLPKNPNYFPNTDANFLPPPGNPFLVGQVRYIIHQLPGETVAPWDTTNPATYPDTEFAKEFGPAYPMPTSLPGMDQTPSVSTVAGIEGPLFKWVRINAVTEWSLGIDVNGDHTLDNNSPIYYDGANLTLSSTNTVQVLSITSLAVLPNGSSKLLQYIVTPSKTLNFGAAITLGGTTVGSNKVTFDYPNFSGGAGSGCGVGSYNFCVDGRDYLSTDAPNHPTSPNPAVLGLGWTDNQQPSYGTNGPPPIQPADHYVGLGGTPSIGNDNNALSIDFQSPSGVDALIKKFKSDKSASTIIISTPATNLDLISAGATTTSPHPPTIIVDNDLNLTGKFTGYGLLVVTGKFNYTGGTTWNGVVLVIGQGWATEDNTAFNGGSFNGAVVLAPSTAGQSHFDFNNPDGSSFYYSNYWINYALPSSGFAIISFHEITQ
jgi:hypothetical protein